MQGLHIERNSSTNKLSYELRSNPNYIKMSYWCLEPTITNNDHGTEVQKFNHIY